MGAVKQTLIYCDGEDCPHEGPFNPDFEAGSAAQQRRNFKANGWRYVKGKDYCPACSERLDAERKERGHD